MAPTPAITIVEVIVKGVFGLFSTGWAFVPEANKCFFLYGNNDIVMLVFFFTFML